MSDKPQDTRWEPDDMIRRQTVCRPPKTGKKVSIVHVKVRLEIEHDDAITMDDVICEMDYGMRSTTVGAEIISTEITQTEGC